LPQTQISYVTHKGTEVNLLSRPYYIEDASPLFSYEWNADISYNRITGFNRAGVVSKAVPIGVAGGSASSVAAAKNTLHDIFETDVFAGNPGRLHVNGYYLDCYIMAEDLGTNMRQMKKSMYKIATDNPVWIRETQTISFSPAGQDDTIWGNQFSVTEAKEYPYGYDYGYPNPSEIHRFVNQSAVPCNFRLIIQGPWDNPSITIAGHVYNVNVTLAGGEQLIIDSMKREIVKVSGGERINAFPFRNREPGKSPFEKIPSGLNEVSWIGEHSFFLTLIEERSAPKWQT